MTKRFIDFDAARAEWNDEPLTMRAYGETFELPSAMPASVMLDVVRMQADNGDEAEISVNDALSLLRRVVPADVLDKLLERDDFSTDDFGELVRLIMGAYMGGDVGEAPAPNREQRRSSTPPTSTPSRGSRGTSNARKTPKASPGRKS